CCRLCPRIDYALAVETLQDENGDGTGAAVAREAAAQLRNQRNAVHALGIGYITQYLMSVCVHNHDVRASRDVTASGLTVHREVVPESLSAQDDLLHQVILSG